MNANRQYYHYTFSTEDEDTLEDSIFGQKSSVFSRVSELRYSVSATPSLYLPGLLESGVRNSLPAPHLPPRGIHPAPALPSPFSSLPEISVLAACWIGSNQLAQAMISITDRSFASCLVLRVSTC